MRASEHVSAAGVDGSPGIAIDRRGNLAVSGTVNGTLPGQSPLGLTDAFLIRYVGH